MNKFWEKRSSGAKGLPLGRPRTFETPEQLWLEACEYFEDVLNNPLKAQELMKSGDLAGTRVDMDKMRPFTVTGLCLFLGVGKGYLHDLKQSLKNKDDELSKSFSVILESIEITIHNQKFDGATAGFFNPTIIAKDLGMVEITKNETTIKIGVDSESEIEYED